MKIKLSKEQSTAWNYLKDTETKRVLYGGQAGGGKSFLICLWQIEARLMYPGTRGYIAREVLKDIKASVLITFFDVARTLGLEKDKDFVYNDQKSIIKFPNESTISLLEVKEKPSDPDFHDLGSTEYTDGAIEEGVAVSKRAAEFLLSRTRYKHDEYNLTAKQLITCNPGPGWIKDEIVMPSIEGIVKRKNKFVRATLESNPNEHFRKNYMEILNDMDDPYDRGRLLHGDWEVLPQTGGGFYKNFDITKHVIEEEYYQLQEPIHISFDENVNPYLACSVWQLEQKVNDSGFQDGWTAYKIDEIGLKHPRNTLKDTCREVMNRYRNHRGGVFVYGDATSKKQDTKLEKGYNFFTLVMEYLKPIGPRLRVPSKNPPVSRRGDFINQVLRNELFGISIKINYICKLSIEDFLQVKEDSDDQEQVVRDARTGVSYQRYGHFTDTDDYFLCEAFSKELNTFMRGPEKHNRVVQNIKKQSSY